MSCHHPPEKVIEDLADSAWDIGAIEWCQVCGAYRLHYNYQTPVWVLPEREQTKPLPGKPVKE